MELELKTARRIAFFDLETTGVDVAKDRIVEIAIRVVSPDGTFTDWNRRINPTVSIPTEATAVHGIKDDDVRGEPRFAEVAKEIEALLDGCDLAGFNVLGFDLPMLMAEMDRARRPLDVAGRRVVDVMRIYHHMEPRDLSGAVGFYLGRSHDAAHSAHGDVAATVEVLHSQLLHYENKLSGDIESLDKLSRGDALDITGKFMRGEGGRAVFTFGKHRGHELALVAVEDPRYLEWAINEGSFPSDARALMVKALRGEEG